MPPKTPSSGGLRRLRSVRPPLYRDTMIIDCGTCQAPKTACADCLVTALLGVVGTVELEQPEMRALSVLSDAGLVPPLRLIS